MESIDSQILKKAHKGLVHWTEKHYGLCKKHGGHTSCTPYATAISKTPMGHPRGPVACQGLIRKMTTHWI